MKIHVVLHRTADLDDWPEKIPMALEGVFQPLEITVRVVPTCFDVLTALDGEADVNVVVLAPKKGMGSILTPVVDRLLEKEARVFFAWYDNMPSLLEDFIDYLKWLLEVKD